MSNNPFCVLLYILPLFTGRQFVPISCCNEDVDQCIGVVGADGRIPKDGPPTSDAVSDNPFLYVEVMMWQLVRM